LTPRTTAHARVHQRASSSCAVRGRPIPRRRWRTAANDPADASPEIDASSDPNLDREAHAAVYASETWGPWDPPLPPLDPRPALMTFDVARALLAARDAGETSLECTLDFNAGKARTLRLAYAARAVEAHASEGVFLDDAAAATETSMVNHSGGVSISESPESTRRGEEPLVTWSDVETIASDEKGAYVLLEGVPATRFQAFSKTTSRACSLMPAGPGFAPTALLAGFSMHRFGVGVDPMQDTERKLRAISPIREGARVLDICTGLAYTSIGASKRGAQVTTVEVDESMTVMCQMNPHSDALFRGKIRQLYGNGADVVPTLPDSSFDRILHDPPTFALAGELFSENFYRELFRVLKPKGVLYHYVGDPSSKSAGNVAKGVVERLKRAGFGGVVIDYDAHGIIAARGRVRPTGGGKKSAPSKANDFHTKKRNRLRDAKPERDARMRRPGRSGSGRRTRTNEEEDVPLPNEFF